MTNQLKTFLSGLLYQLVDLRMHSRELRGQYQDWSKWGRISGRIDLAAELGLISHDQWVDLHRLLSSASDCLGMPFPHQGNAGPLMPLIVAHDRRQAAAESPVQAVSFDAVPAVTCMGGYDFVDAGQVKPLFRLLSLSLLKLDRSLKRAGGNRIWLVKLTTSSMASPYAIAGSIPGLSLIAS